MRTVVYVRVSTLRQAQAQTLEQQLDRLRADFRTRGLELASEDIFPALCSTHHQRCSEALIGAQWARITNILIHSRVGGG